MSLSAYVAVYFGVNVEIFNVPQSMGLQKVGHNWATELNWTEMLKSHSLYNKGLSWSCFMSIEGYLGIHLKQPCKTNV